jgi:hypothetical protein
VVCAGRGQGRVGRRERAGLSQERGARTKASSLLD